MILLWKYFSTQSSTASLHSRENDIAEMFCWEIFCKLSTSNIDLRITSFFREKQFHRKEVHTVIVIAGCKLKHKWL